MTQGVKMKKTREYRMAQLVPVKGKTLINPVEVVLAGGGKIMRQMMVTTITKRKENWILEKDGLVDSAIGRTEVKEGVLVHLEMKNEEAEGVEVVAVVEVEEGLVVEVEEEGSLTDIVEVTERKCSSQIRHPN